MKIDNRRAIKRIEAFLEEEMGTDVLIKALDDAYFIIAQHAAEVVDSGGDMSMPRHNTLEETLYEIDALKRALLEEDE